jgi:hypothetical protein
MRSSICYISSQIVGSALFAKLKRRKGKRRKEDTERHKALSKYYDNHENFHG